jgi:hypothetical protein
MEAMTMMFDPGKTANSLLPSLDTNAQQVCLEHQQLTTCVGQPQAYSEVEQLGSSPIDRSVLFAAP